MQQLIAIVVMLLSMPAWAAESSSSSGLLGKISAAIDSVVSFVKGLFDLFNKVVAWLSQLIVQIFKAGWDFITDAFIWLLEGIFTLTAGLLKNLSDGLGIDDMSSSFYALWSEVPPEVVSVLVAIGIPSALGIVVTGLIIRMSMQLIPFVRLGS